MPEPILSIVTPSLDQADWLGDALESVAREASDARDALGLGPGAIEHLIMDGGSTDGSARIIADHAARHPDLVTHWVSAPDKGQSDAINRGLERARGRFATWLNADDWYEQGGLVAWCRAIIEQEAIASKPAATEPGATEPKADVLVGRCRFVDEAGATVWDPVPPEPMSVANFLRLRTQWFNARMIVQPEACFRLDAFRAVGGLNEDNHYSMDHELWVELALAGCRFVSLDARVACLRVHADQKSANNRAVVRSMLATGRRVLHERAQGQADASDEALVGELAGVQDELEAVATKLRVADGLIARFDLVRAAEKGIRHEALGIREEEENEEETSGIREETASKGERGPSAGSLAPDTHQSQMDQRLHDALRTLAEPHTRKALKVAMKHVGKRVRVCAHTSAPPNPSAPAAPTTLDAILSRTFRVVTHVDEGTDVAVLDNALVYEPNPAEVIRSLWDALRPGGVLIVLNELVPAPGLLDYLASLERHLCDHLAANNELILHPEADGWLGEGTEEGTRHWALGIREEEEEEGTPSKGDRGPIASAGSLGDARAWFTRHPSCMGTDIAALLASIAPDAQSLMHRRHGSYWFHPLAPFPFVPGIVSEAGAQRAGVQRAGAQRPVAQEDTRLTGVWLKPS